MRFLKTLQRAKLERGQAPIELEVERPNSNSAAEPAPEFVSDIELRIGRPSRPDDVLLETKPIVEEMGSVREITSLPRRSSFGEAAVSAKHYEFGQLEIHPHAVNPRLVSITEPNSPYCEDYRGLRTQLIAKGHKQKLRSIVVVSYGQSEGKTVTALNLSWLLAQTEGVKALIIDGDMRLPSVANYLGIEADIGLSNVLAGDIPLEKAVIKLNPAGLHLLPGGTTYDNVAELASGPKFRELLDEVSAHFDFVIIDAPPLSLFSDGAIYMNNCDGALLVIRANHVRYSDIDRVLDSVPREKLLGAIVNQSDEALANRGYYEYSYYRSQKQ